jgi:pimeloyl-ACP methyl ester carboxylesterase
MNAVDLELVDQGTGLPVVFSHGGSSDVRYWEPQRAVFAARYRFVAFSRRFHGTGSWSDDADNSDDAHVSDLLDVIGRVGGGPVHLVGFSSAIALRYTAAGGPHRSRERVTSPTRAQSPTPSDVSVRSNHSRGER